MQSYAVFLLIAASVFGHVNARVVSIISVPGNEVGLPLECPFKVVPDTNKTVLGLMLTKVHDECYKPSPSFLRQINAAPDTAAFRGVFQGACDRVPATRSCLADVSRHVDACLDENENKLWAIVMDLLDSCIAEICDDGSETVSKVFGEELKVMRLGNQLRMISCIYATNANYQYDSDIDMSTNTLRKYNAIKGGRQCIINVAKQGGTSSVNFQRLSGNVITSMKCMSLANEIVPCHTLEAAAISDN